MTGAAAPADGIRFELQHREGRLSLCALHHPGYHSICADWGSSDLRRRLRAGRKQLLPRAAGLHKDPDLSLLDATAGLGRDGFLLAALGARVTLVERNPEVFRLVEDAHRRALADPALAGAAGRVTLLRADARTLFDRNWDVILLDPMYPHEGRTALARKEMQLLRELCGPDADADGLLAPARACAARVVVKRDAKAPPLAGVSPAFVLAGSQARFDVYLGTGGNA